MEDIANTEMLRETLAGTADTAGLLGLMEDEYQRQVATTFAQRRRLLEYVKGLSVTIGTLLLPQLNELMATIMPIVSSMTEWAAAHPEVVKLAFSLVGGLLVLKGSTLPLQFAFAALATPVPRLIWAGS